MPGYDVTRFVNLTKSEEEMLTCHICQDVLKNAVVAPCCLQTFCDDCIRDWLKKDNTCPNDRKSMTESDLIRAARMVTKMLGKLQICCDYEGNGCKQIVQLKNLASHCLKCRFKFMTKSQQIISNG